jgi:hypothetical protein
MIAPAPTFTAEIHRDDAPFDPRGDGWNMGHMVTWHRGYRLGDERPTISPEAYLAGLEGEHVILPLYLYEHGAITMRTTPFSCPWDSGQVGYIHVDLATAKETLRKDERETLEEFRLRVEDALRKEVAVYDAFLRGDIYGYIVYQLVDGEYEEVDSCWGFLRVDDDGDAIDAMVGGTPKEYESALRQAWERLQG